MPDDSELDYIQTFLEEVTTDLIVETYITKRHITQVAGDKKCFVFPGVPLSTDGNFYKKRYLVQLSLENEVNLMSIFNEILVGINLYNNTRVGLTSVAVMCFIHCSYGTRTYVKNNRWGNDIYLDIEWSTS